MRPPLNAGENCGGSLAGQDTGRSFNEAPAERGGKQDFPVLDGQEAQIASMRPPLNAGENST